MHDLIERQAAIDAHYEYCNKHPDAGFPVWSLKILENLPSAQPESCDDTISRKAAIEIASGFCHPANIAKELAKLPSAQPDISAYSDKLWKRAYERGKAEAQPDLDEVYAHAETEAEARYHAERKKGKWIDDEGNTVTDKYCAICSACGEWSEYLTAYCPNCGAEMTEGEG